MNIPPQLYKSHPNFGISLKKPTKTNSHQISDEKSFKRAKCECKKPNKTSKKKIKQNIRFNSA
jgi:hypothetical protein